MKKDKFMAAMKASKQMAKHTKGAESHGGDMMKLAGRKKNKEKGLTFKKSDMKDLAQKDRVVSALSDHKYYPSVTFDKSDLKIGDAGVGDKVTVHVHGVIKGINQRDGGVHRVEVELQKGTAKKGHNPSGKDDKKPKRTWYLSPKDVPKKGQKVDPKKLKQYPDSEDDVEWTE